MYLRILEPALLRLCLQFVYLLAKKKEKFQLIGWGSDGGNPPSELKRSQSHWSGGTRHEFLNTRSDRAAKCLLPRRRKEHAKKLTVSWHYARFGKSLYNMLLPQVSVCQSLSTHQYIIYIHILYIWRCH